MRILGISAFYHDSAAALVEDGRIVAAAQEERFTRKKHDSGLPAATRSSYCLAEARHRARRRRPRRLLRQAVPEVRAAARDLPRLRAARLPVVPHGDPALAEGEAVPEEPAHATSSRSSRPDFDWETQAAVHRAPPEPRGERLLPLALRARRPCSRWTASASGPRPRSASATATTLEMQPRDPLPALARPALLGLHLLHRLQGELRRVQGDGARALRRAAATRRLILDTPDRPEGRRLASASTIDYFDYCTGLTMTNARFDALFGGPAAQARGAAHAAPHGPRRLRPGGDRGGRAAPDALARRARPARRTSASPAAWRSTASPTARCCATARFEQHLDPAGGGRRRRRARRGARRLPPASRPAAPARTARGDAHARRLPRPALRDTRTSSSACAAAGARFDDARRRRADRRDGRAPSPTARRVGWFQGRMEFGPRALGARSILGDAALADACRRCST